MTAREACQHHWLFHNRSLCLTRPDVSFILLKSVLCRHHPDLKGSQAANRFVKIQEAYEVVTGKRRGSTVEETKQAAKTGSWDFHDWYMISLHQYSVFEPGYHAAGICCVCLAPQGHKADLSHVYQPQRNSCA